MKQNQIEKLSADYVTDSFADIIDLKHKLIKILIPVFPLYLLYW